VEKPGRVSAGRKIARPENLRDRRDRGRNETFFYMIGLNERHSSRAKNIDEKDPKEGLLRGQKGLEFTSERNGLGRRIG